MLEKKDNMENNSSSVAAANGATGSNSNSDDTLYLCNFQVFADGDWLCLKELDDQDTSSSASSEISRQRKPPDSLAITPELDRLEKIYPNSPVGNPKGLFLILFVSICRYLKFRRRKYVPPNKICPK